MQLIYHQMNDSKRLADIIEAIDRLGNSLSALIVAITADVFGTWRRSRSDVRLSIDGPVGGEANSDESAMSIT